MANRNTNMLKVNRFKREQLLVSIKCWQSWIYGFCISCASRFEQDQIKSQFYVSFYQIWYQSVTSLLNVDRTLSWKCFKNVSVDRTKTPNHQSISEKSAHSSIGLLHRLFQHRSDTPNDNANWYLLYYSYKEP